MMVWSILAVLFLLAPTVIGVLLWAEKPGRR